MSDNDDLRRELEALARQREAEKQSKDLFLRHWKRFRQLRDALGRELEFRKSGLPSAPEDPKEVERREMATLDLKLSLVRAEAAVASAALLAHRASGGLFGWRRVFPEYRSETGRLQACEQAALKAVSRVATENLLLKSKLRDRVTRQFKTSKSVYDHAMAPLQPMMARLAAMDVAMDALRAQNPSCSACLRRWEVDNLLRCGLLWRRIEVNNERLPQDQLDFYAACENGPVGVAATDGNIIDAEWSEVRSSTARQILIGNADRNGHHGKDS